MSTPMRNLINLAKTKFGQLSNDQKFELIAIANKYARYAGELLPSGMILEKVEDSADHSAAVLIFSHLVVEPEESTIEQQHFGYQIDNAVIDSDNPDLTFLQSIDLAAVIKRLTIYREELTDVVSEVSSLINMAVANQMVVIAAKAKD